MVSAKFLLALLPLALTATALPGSKSSLVQRQCFPPTGCTLVGDCEYCCASNPGGVCHPAHEGAPCPNPSHTKYHCDDSSR
ncbi:hypothetical protein C7999DRAFT_36602 [Corynascus novoguineensis]|uniref:Uncharacterized protein n=1 Tax=Corynascus novoguineensis TaxID=1126955 RepID=A0AAN7HAW9_9PEZI|nr:hypothetical protein C7999DRAFT_36602 [Corynascus novoguineensis]